MLELTARHADAWNLAWFGRPDERLARVRGELLDACERVGRDPASLSMTVGVTVRYPDEVAEPAEPPDVAGPGRHGRGGRRRAGSPRGSPARTT